MKIKAIIKFKYIYLATLTAITAAYSTTSVADVSEPTIKQMIARADELNSKCRGGSGDDPVTHVACYDRDKLHSELQKAGWCWGRPEQYGYEKKWERCGAQLNPKDQANLYRRAEGSVDPFWIKFTSGGYFMKPASGVGPALVATVKQGSVYLNLLDTSKGLCKEGENSGPNDSSPYKINDTYVRFYSFCVSGNRVFGPSTPEGKKFLINAIYKGSTKIELDSGTPLIFYATDFESVRKELLKTESAL